MIVYNELIAVSAGAGLLGFAWFLRLLITRGRVDSEGWAGFFGVTGVLLLILGIHTTVNWPYGAGGFEYANIAFGQPAAAFGALLLFVAIWLWRHRGTFADGTADGSVDGYASALSGFKPISLFVGVLGLVMAVLAISFVRYQLGAAPPEEPISGRFGDMPILEALFLGGLWGIVALGAILFAIALLTDRPGLLRWAIWAWVIGGIVFVLFGAMNYYTHIGMYHNIEHGTSYKW